MVASAAEDFGEEFQDGFVRSGVDGRGGDLDLQFVADRTGDFVARGAGLDFQGNANAVLSLLEIWGHRVLILGVGQGNSTPKLDRVCDWH